MKYLLDTNTCIRYINGRAPQIRVKMASIPRSELGVSIITKAELYFGSAKSEYPERSLAKQTEFLTTIHTVPFDEQAARVYGALRTNLERAGTPIGSLDMLIAATALANQPILVTHNTREFGRVENLTIEDWETA